MNYRIEKEFTDMPGGRFKDRGEHSGEAFRDDILVNLLEECKKNNEQLMLDLDGTLGYPPSFLEETFGGLIRKYNYKKDEINKLIVIKSEEEPKLKVEIQGYLTDAEKEKNKLDINVYT